MQFVYDNEPATAEVRHIAFLSQHDGETFRRRDQKGRAVLSEFGAIRLRRVTRAQMDLQFLFQAHSHDRRAQIFLDVVGQGPQGRNVNALHSIGRFSAVQLPQQVVKHAEEAGQCFSAACW
jgi:hypothetical protein